MAEDLTQAIQAATDALYAAEMGQMLRDPGWRTAAHIAIQAAAPHLHIDLQRRLQQAEAELEQFRDLLQLAERCINPYVDGEDSTYTQASALHDLEAWLRQRERPNG